VTNRELAKSLGRSLGRPSIAPMPAFVIKLLAGEMADEMLLASTRVIPAKLLKAGYRFQHSDLEEFLRRELAA
ncbi:MAG: DUF1731 domain-containing protein, partial [Candidatus Zixiibacteriota bacterium]